MDKKLITILIVSVVVIFASVLAYFKIMSPAKVTTPVSQNNPTFSLEKNTPNARAGDIWITQNENGLVVKGSIDGDKAKWPEIMTDDMAVYDHVELWVTDTQNPKLPPIGWGNQFGNPTLNSEKDCDGNKNDQTEQPVSNPAQCKKWFEDQVKYRQQFEKLFVRQWQLAPNVVKETYASVAYNSFPNDIQKDLKSLQPTITPSIKVSDDTTGKHAYDFQIEIPWSALPPTQSLNLKNIKILVDVFSPGEGHLKYGPYSSISSNHTYGDTSAFKTFTFSQSRQYSITSCKYDLGSNYGISKPVFSDGAVPYILPSDNLNIDKTLMIDNTIQGYQHDPSGSSPTVYELNYFEKSIQPGEIICGPQLSYVKNSQILKTENSIASTSLEVKHLSDNEVLVKNGPYTFYSYYGSGQCGACTRGALNVTYLNLKNAISAKAYSFMSVFYSNDVDFQISPDWKKITEYDYGPSENADKNADNRYDSSLYGWSSTNYCFNNQTYVYDECGKNIKTTPPSPRFFSPQLNGYPKTKSE